MSIAQAAGSGTFQQKGGSEVAWSLPSTTSTYSVPTVCQLPANDAEAPQISARGATSNQVGEVDV